MEYDLDNLLDPCMELKRIYSNGNRYYLAPDDKRYMSVTTMLSGNTEKAIQAWRDRVGDIEADKVSLFASTVGTNVHDLVERHLLNMEIPKDHALSYSIYRSFIPALKFIDNIQGIELPVYSDTLKLAGTLDLLADYKGVLSLIDHKTSKTQKKIEWLDNYMLQATAYIVMIKQRYGITVKQIVLFIGCRDGDFQVVKSDPKKHINRLIQSNRKFNPLLQ